MLKALLCLNGYKKLQCSYRMNKTVEAVVMKSMVP